MSECWRLYADAGNSAVKWAVSAGDRWLAQGRSDLDVLDAEVLRSELIAAGLDPGACVRAALVSSRPSLADKVMDWLAAATGAGVRLLGRDLTSDIVVDYYDPGEIGQDRLAAAEGAVALHGVPVIVLSLGTCLTAQALDNAGVLVGGIIAAGLEAQVAGISATVPHLREAIHRSGDSLRSAGAAPDVGRSTDENLTAGLRAALVGTVETMIAAMRERVGAAPVIATGGDAELARALGACFDYVEPLLVLEGLKAVDERADER